MAVAYEYVWRNKLRSLLWAALLPISFAVMVMSCVFISLLCVALIKYTSPDNLWHGYDLIRTALVRSYQISYWAVPFSVCIAVFWAYQGLQQGDQMILEAIHATPLPRWNAPEAYELLSTLCIRSGLVEPKLYVLDDPSMNAFSVGLHPKRSAIVLSGGVLDRLSRTELEAVLAHELVHIQQYDPRANVMLVMSLGFFTFAGETLLYGLDENAQTLRQEEKFLVAAGKSPFQIAYWKLWRRFNPVAWILLGYGYVLAPFLRAGLSAARELQTDAQAVLMTRYPAGLRKALWKMQADSRLEILDQMPLVGVMCIQNPYAKPTFFDHLSGLYRAYPPLVQRLKALHDMDGMFDSIPPKRAAKA